MKKNNLDFWEQNITRFDQKSLKKYFFDKSNIKVMISVDSRYDSYISILNKA